MPIKPLHCFTVDQLKGWSINIVSVFNGKLLVSSVSQCQLFIFSWDGRYLSTVSTNTNDKLYDAVWTPLGNIAYVTDENNKVVVMSECGQIVITHYLTTGLQCLCVSNDGIIYLTAADTGVYQSADDGISWNLVFKPTDGWLCQQVAKVTTDHCDDFWALEKCSYTDYRLRVYSVDRRQQSTDQVTSRDITLDNKIVFLPDCSLSYDGNMRMFLSDYNGKAIHTLPINCRNHCRLQSTNDVKNKPWRIAVDRNCQLLHVGQENGLVEVFNLTDGCCLKDGFKFKNDVGLVSKLKLTDKKILRDGNSLKS